MKIARVRNGAVLLGAHTPLKALYSLRDSGFLRLRNGASLHPRISPLTVRFKSFFHEQSKLEEKKMKKCDFSCGFSFSSDFDGGKASDWDFVVVNFYRFVYIKDPEEEISKHLSFLQEIYNARIEHLLGPINCGQRRPFGDRNRSYGGPHSGWEMPQKSSLLDDSNLLGRDIHGRVYVNEQGINAQYSGPSKDALSYVEWLKQDRRFSDILVQISPALSGHAFPRLKLQYKPSLVQLEGGISHLPLLDPAMRATPLVPSEWRKRLEAVNSVEETSFRADNSHLNRKLLLLDVRNGYEWDVGHFQGAPRPDVDCFRDTSFGLSESGLTTSDPLAGIDKEHTDVLMYCTGGIRCDVYSAILRQKGFQNLYTLKGGVSHYLESEGPVEWVGNLFVFDSRLSLLPAAYKSEAAAEGEAELVSENSTFARCYICGSQIHELRHRNCANLDCNLLFLSCSNCVKDLRGCCCSDCTSAPRLRPVLPGHQRYQKWHIYRDGEVRSQSVI